MRNVVVWKLIEHIISQPLDNSLTGFSTATRAVLWLNAQNGVQARLGQVTLVTESRNYYVNHSAYRPEQHLFAGIAGIACSTQSRKDNLLQAVLSEEKYKRSLHTSQVTQIARYGDKCTNHEAPSQLSEDTSTVLFFILFFEHSVSFDNTALRTNLRQ